jgi:acetyl-CoA synthetase
VADEKGYFWFYGRFDDIIKTGGYRVGPYEVENVLMEHPAVLECSVVGVPDTLRGQAIKAFVVLDGRFQPSRELEKEIKDACNRKLAEYKWIRLVEFVQEMPENHQRKGQKKGAQEYNVIAVPNWMEYVSYLTQKFF